MNQLEDLMHEADKYAKSLGSGPIDLSVTI